MTEPEKRRQWVVWKVYPAFPGADAQRAALIKGFEELEQGHNIQIKHKSDGYNLRIAKDLIKPETRKSLGIK